jgi:hypothetical protein
MADLVSERGNLLTVWQASGQQDLPAEPLGRAQVLRTSGLPETLAALDTEPVAPGQVH